MIANTLKKTFFYIVQVPNIYKNDSVLVYQSNISPVSQIIYFHSPVRGE